MKSTIAIAFVLGLVLGVMGCCQWMRHGRTEMEIEGFGVKVGVVHVAPEIKAEMYGVVAGTGEGTSDR